MFMGAVLTTVVIAFCACVAWDVTDHTAKRLRKKKKKTKVAGGEKDASL